MHTIMINSTMKAVNKRMIDGSLHIKGIDLYYAMADVLVYLEFQGNREGDIKKVNEKIEELKKGCKNLCFPLKQKKIERAEKC